MGPINSKPPVLLAMLAAAVLWRAAKRGLCFGQSNCNGTPSQVGLAASKPVLLALLAAAAQHAMKRGLSIVEVGCSAPRREVRQLCPALLHSAHQVVCDVLVTVSCIFEVSCSARWRDIRQLGPAKLSAAWHSTPYWQSEEWSSSGVRQLCCAWLVTAWHSEAQHSAPC
jgi:hypothetical protein